MIKYRTAYYALQVTWFKSTMQLDVTERHNMERRGSRYTLIIRNVQRSDFANYTCTAENSLGKVRRFVALTGKPNVAVVRSNALSAFKDRYNLTWTVQSAAPVLETRVAYRKLLRQGGISGGGGGLAGMSGSATLGIRGATVGGGGGSSRSSTRDTELIENDLMSMPSYNMYNKPQTGYWPMKNDWHDVILPNVRLGNEVEQRLSYMIRDLEPDTSYEVNITSR